MTITITVTATIMFCNGEHHRHRSASWGPRALLSSLIQGVYLLANEDGIILLRIAVVDLEASTDFGQYYG